VIMVNAGMSSVGWMWLAQMVARSASRLVKLCTGWFSSVCLREALASGVSGRWAAATGSGCLAAAEDGCVEDWRGDAKPRSVSSPRPSNRACGSPAHGSPTPFTDGVRPEPAGPMGPGCDDDAIEGNKTEVGR
jgi:hypothetical protein